MLEEDSLWLHTYIKTEPFQCWKQPQYSYDICTFISGEQGMVDEAQKALEEAEALKKVCFLS